MNNKDEYVVCSAIYYPKDKQYLYQPDNIKKGIVVLGLRHCNCFALLITLFPNREYIGQCSQGFLTSKNRFVSRQEAAILAFKSKQIDSQTETLYSEDIF